MSDNERHQAAEQASNPARRRRRRSRRRGGSTGRHTDSATTRRDQTRRDQTRTQQEGTPDHNQAADQQSLSEQPRRRRRRRRPTGTRAGTRTGTSARTGTSQRRDRVERAEGVGVDKRDKPAEGRARRRPQKRRTQKTTSGARTRVGPRPRMHTSMETSAGGLVVSGLAEAVRDDGTVDLDRLYVALIGRLDRRGRLLWSMPKGHVEVGEQHDRTAEREVWEETGIYGEVLAELGVIDYWFVSEGKRIHKTVHHHLLRFLDGDLNDEDPEVTEVAWVPVSELIERLAYADERKLARRAHDMLPEVARREKAEGRITPR